MTDAITTADGTELDVADTPSDARTIVTGATVSGSEKANLGNYENVEPHASIRVEFRPAVAFEDGDGRAAVQGRLNRLRGMIDQHLKDSIQHARDPEVHSE